MGIEDSIDWCVDSGVVSDVDISYGITFSIDYKSVMSSSDYYFGGLNDGKPVG